MSEMDITKEDKQKKQPPTTRTRNNGGEKIVPSKSMEKKTSEKSTKENGVRDSGETRGPVEVTPIVDPHAQSLASLTETLAHLAQGLKAVEQNQSEMVGVMMAAGGEPFFPKGKGRGKRSLPREEDTCVTKVTAPAKAKQVPAKAAPQASTRGEPSQKRRRGEHDMSEEETYDSENDYDCEYNGYDDDNSEPEYVSDEVENQIDAFLRTAQETVFPVQKIQPPSAAAGAATASTSTAQTPLLGVEDVLDEGLANLAQDLATDEDVGPDISLQLADIFTGLLSRKLPDEKVKTRIDENPPPKNVPLLHPPRVNECVWELLKAGPRSADIRMRKVQVRLTRGLVALARLADQLLKHKKNGTITDLGEGLNKAIQAFALISTANYEISLRRRETLKSQLNPRFNRLCYPSTPVTANLFGDDVTKQVEDINKVQRLGANLGQNFGGRFNNNYNNNYGNRGYNRGYGGRNRGSRGSFRGQRGRGDSKNSKWRGNSFKNSR